ncbi:MAG: hypothetical protein U0L88_01480 [Acutalibacteraceae bacterium]|nr:hypothetical protein [Acutalibacteraceae bacterium]
MKFYLYDEKTKQFIKEQEGYLDPLETKAQGKNVYIVPPFSTAEKPNLTSLKDNEILVFKGGKWTVEQEFYVGKFVNCQGERAVKYVTDNDLTFEKCDGGFKIVEKPVPKEKTLEELKEDKHAELKQIMRNKRQNVKVNYDNDTFDANEEAQANMIVLLKAFDLGAKTVSIRSSTEETHVFDKEHCQELSLIMLSAVQAIYDQYWELKNRLAACETIAEVETITWQEASK